MKKNYNLKRILTTSASLLFTIVIGVGLLPVPNASATTLQVTGISEGTWQRLDPLGEDVRYLESLPGQQVLFWRTEVGGVDILRRVTYSYNPGTGLVTLGTITSPTGFISEVDHVSVLNNSGGNLEMYFQNLSIPSSTSLDYAVSTDNGGIWGSQTTINYPFPTPPGIGDSGQTGGGGIIEVGGERRHYVQNNFGDIVMFSTTAGTSGPVTNRGRLITKGASGTAPSGASYSFENQSPSGDAVKLPTGDVLYFYTDGEGAEGTQGAVGVLVLDSTGLGFSDVRDNFIHITDAGLVAAGATQLDEMTVSNIRYNGNQMSFLMFLDGDSTTNGSNEDIFYTTVTVTFNQIVAPPNTIKWVDAANGSDSNDGNTEATAFQTLQKALNESVSGNAANRSYIYIKDGTYGTQGLTGTPGCYGEYYATAILIKELDYLTIQAVAGHEPKVKPVTSVAADIVSITIENSDHLIVDNLDSDQTIAQFDNWHVCNSNDLTLRNAEFRGGEDGIDFNTSLDTALIENNDFIDIKTGSGDEVLDFTDGSYANIVIQDNYFKNNYRQITIDPPSGHSTSNFLIRRNFMNGTTSQEAVRLTGVNQIGVNDITIENNVILDSMQQGIYIDNHSANIKVWHNTFFNNGFEELRTKVNAAHIQIKNNIFYANGTYAAIGAASPYPLPGEDYNLIFNSGSQTESSSQPAVTAFGSNTIVGSDPLFVSTTPGSEDLHLQPGSPAIQAGLELGVTDDIEQAMRPNPAGSYPDMGAYEIGVIDNQGPITTNVLATPNPAPINTTITLTANIDDTTTGGSNIALAEYSLDGGVTWTAMAASDGTFDEVIEDVTVTFTSSDTPDVVDLCVQGKDSAGIVGDPACIMFVVFDPEGGFVTGGGWIWSPPEAFYADPTLEGEANFGFVAKYKKGTRIPEGETEFMFQPADLNFHSLSYDWLVIRDTTAQFTGKGTINGELADNGTPYRFTIWAVDNAPDTFHIKIWYVDGMNVYAIYDSDAQQLGGGSIIVHKK